MFPFLVPFSFVLSFRSVVFRLILLRFSFRFLAFLRGGFCYYVISSRRYTPPRAPGEPEVCVFPVGADFCLLSCVLDADLFYFFFSSFPFFDFDLDIVCFILSFPCGYYAVSSVSVSAATRLAYNVYRDKCVRTLISPFLLLPEVYDLFQLSCVSSSVFVSF